MEESTLKSTLKAKKKKSLGVSPGLQDLISCSEGQIFTLPEPQSAHQKPDWSSLFHSGFSVIMMIKYGDEIERILQTVKQNHCFNFKMYASVGLQTQFH